MSLAQRLYTDGLRTWAWLAGRPGLQKLNSFFLNLGLRGLGVGNSGALSGEHALLKRLAADWRRRGRDAVLIDVGANKGDYTKILRDYCPEARVVAFEPHPVTSQRLIARMAGCVEVIAKGLGEKPGHAILWDHAGQTGSEHASLVPGLIERMYAGGSQGVEVNVTSLDVFCEESGIQAIDFLKLDVEGHEASCLRGARRMLAGDAIRMVQFEFNILHVASRTFFDDFAALLPGFRFYRLLPHGCVELNTQRVIRCHFYDIQNIVAVSPRAYADAPERWQYPLG